MFIDGFLVLSFFWPQVTKYPTKGGLNLGVHIHFDHIGTF